MAPVTFFATLYTLLPPSATRGDCTTAHSYHNKREDSPPASFSRQGSFTTLLKQAQIGSARSRRIPALVAAFVGVLIVGAWCTKADTAIGCHLYGETRVVQYNARGKVAVDFETNDVPSEWSCNPYKEPGKLVVDLQNPHNNIWEPYDEECPPSKLMEGAMRTATRPPKTGKRSTNSSPPQRNGPLRSHDSSRPLPMLGNGSNDQLFPWLVNATILLQGDSMERLHLTDFCDMIGGKLNNITPLHPASPPTYRKSMPTILGPDGVETQESIQAKQNRIAVEDHWENGRANSWFFTRPWVCDIQEYSATLVSVFAWGLEDMEYAYQDEEFYHGPSTWTQRFHHITLPLLTNLAQHLNRPQILHPTLIEISAGFWDLRALTEEDFITRGIPRPYPKDSDIPFGNIGADREKRWAKHAKEVVETVAGSFLGEQGVRDGPVITWRTLHHPKRNNYTPYTRAFALDQLARKTLHDLRVSSLTTHPTVYSSAKKAWRKTKDHYFHMSSSLTAEKSENIVDFGFDERLRVNEIGPLLLGQENHFKDFLHPNPYPGSYLWSDIMLYELKRAVLRIGRTHK